MYVIIVYDLVVENINKVREFLRTYLHWVQNSVFEGELTNSEYVKVKNFLSKLINFDNDSILIYKLKSKYEFEREVIGCEKNEIQRIL